ARHHPQRALGTTGAAVATAGAAFRVSHPPLPRATGVTPPGTIRNEPWEPRPTASTAPNLRDRVSQPPLPLRQT
ncbi:hypothetical protein, partial [Arthrobacter koreensis]|uniref:hypothetical protein n=1 Tax=Arthrobacter koreensis TaxID=199136 RepID=UPI002DB83AB5